ncbi:type III PLP-dependent enzyme [Amycolatopsis sp. CA-230715]|uniref:type III PLP-dependent enzyme n=1 Tax=Amycolatopsis sp. CA-230715 TaxID=2745196 RepID=UPI001C009608|nr:type III PLP-dependent enzyme [Amycolatopsis sp. CA-230715]QWF77498.1 Lysine/ornithine decarboxylase [Amycolatopsis sp. CA-230715]
MTALPRLRRFLAEHAPPTPCLVLDLDTVADRAGELAREFPGARLCYAVKANPEPAVVARLVVAGMSFDVASTGEVDLCRSLGAPASGLSYGNTIKKPSDIAYAFGLGVREFVTDAEGDLRAIAEHAPGSAVTVRLLVDGPASATPFGRKFGCSPTIAADLLVLAAELGLDPAGVGFHPGSQQLDPGAWEPGIAAAAKVFADAAARGVRARRLNLGGGMAVGYRGTAPSIAAYATAIRGALTSHFPGATPELVLEPGRVLVAEAGLIRTEVVLVRDDEQRWVFLDIGRYNGLAETENEAIAYRVEPVTARDGADTGVVLAGPTCDGDDVLYLRTPYRLPASLRAGDLLDILDAGAYTASYSSVSFNGIPPLRTYCIEGTDEG